MQKTILTDKRSGPIYPMHTLKALELKRFICREGKGIFYQKNTKIYKILLAKEEKGNYKVTSVGGGEKRSIDQCGAISEGENFLGQIETLCRHGGHVFDPKAHTINVLVNSQVKETIIFHPDNKKLLAKSIVALFSFCGFLICIAKKKIMIRTVFTKGICAICMLLYYKRKVQQLCVLKEHKIDDNGNVLKSGTSVGKFLERGEDGLVLGYSMSGLNCNLDELVNPEVALGLKKALLAKAVCNVINFLDSSKTDLILNRHKIKGDQEFLEKENPCPLDFIGAILDDGKTHQAMKNILKSQFISTILLEGLPLERKGLCRGIKSRNENRNFLEKVEGFAQKYGKDFSRLKEHLEKEEWRGFIEFLIN